MCIWKLLSKFYISQSGGEVCEAGSGSPSGVSGTRWQRSLAAQREKAFAQLSVEKKFSVLERWRDSVTLPWYMVERTQQLFQKPGAKRILGCGVLLTFMGPWYMTDAAGQAEQYEGLSLAEVVDKVRQTQAWQKKWEAMREHAAKLTELLFASDHACCLEVCPRIFACEKKARLHLHIFVRSSQKMFVSHMSLLAFEDITPQAATMVGGLQTSGSSRRACFAGMFYCVVQKHGQVFQYTTREPFRDFLVNGTWVMNLLQSGKIGVELAKSLLQRTCSSHSRWSKEISAVEQAEERAVVSLAISQAEKALSAIKRPFRVLPSVSLWQTQYESHAYRYRMLILEGPSKIGKTIYARSLTPPNRSYLELNCTSGAEPDLRSFRFSQHGLILFDEIGPSTVLKQRKLFQAGPVEIQLGCSTTNCFAYCVCLYQVRLVLCSNTWTAEMSQLIEEDQAWLRSNTVHEVISEALWE